MTKLKFDYFDLLSGEPVFVQGVGHLRSPFVGELFPMTGIGYDKYKMYINFLMWDKEQILDYDKIVQVRGVDKLSNPALSTFDTITLIKHTREFFAGVLSFFITEQIIWDEQNRQYVSFYYPRSGEGAEEDDDKAKPVIVGGIDKSNFEDVRKRILQMVFVGLDEDDKPITHASDKAKELWERAEGYLKQQEEKEKNRQHPENNIGNIVSKVCALHPSYNLLNIKKLTVFQLYDAFFQINYMRTVDLAERIFSQHGGDKFNFEDWQKPIIKI